MAGSWPRRTTMEQSEWPFVRHEFRIAKQYRYRVNAQYRMDRSTVPVPCSTVKIFFPRWKGSRRGWTTGLGSRMVFGVARKEETTVEKVPHPRLMVQSGPAVLFAHLSTSTDGTTTVLHLHHHRCRHYADTDTYGHPRRQPAHFDAYFSPLRSREGGFPCFSSPPFVSPRPPRRGGKGARGEGGFLWNGCAQYGKFSADDGAELGINFKIIRLGFSRLSKSIHDSALPSPPPSTVNISPLRSSCFIAADFWPPSDIPIYLNFLNAVDRKVSSRRPCPPRVFRHLPPGHPYYWRCSASRSRRGRWSIYRWEGFDVWTDEYEW